MRTAILYDTETTGLINNSAIPLKDQPRIVELFGVKVSIEPGLPEVGRWHSLFHVKKMEEDAIKTHGITLDMLKDAPPFAAMFPDLCDFFLGTSAMIGHNLAFDRDQLEMEVRRLGKHCAFPWPPIHVDTVEATEGWEGYRLGLAALHEKLFGEGFPEAHRADADTLALLRCVRQLYADGVIKL